MLAPSHLKKKTVVLRGLLSFWALSGLKNKRHQALCLLITNPEEVSLKNRQQEIGKRIRPGRPVCPVFRAYFPALDLV